MSTQQNKGATIIKNNHFPSYVTLPLLDDDVYDYFDDIEDVLHAEISSQNTPPLIQTH